MAHISDQIFNPNRLHVVLIGGRAGSGKTTLSGEIVRKTGFAPVDKDVTNPFSEALLKQLGSTPDDRQSPEYLKGVRPIEYEVLKAGIFKNIKFGNSVVADAPFGPEFADSDWRQKLEEECRDKAGKSPVTVHYVVAHVEDDVLKQRLIARGEDRDRHKLASEENWQEFLSKTRTQAPIEPTLFIDCSHASAEDCADQVIEALHLLQPVFPGRFSKPQFSRPAA